MERIEKIEVLDAEKASGRFEFSGKDVATEQPVKVTEGRFQVTLIPTYAAFTKLGWNGTWLPLIVPHFFANAFNVFMTSLGGVLAAIGIVLNLMLWWMVIRPVTRLAQFADKISLGELETPELTRRAKDEITGLGQSINRMRTSLVQAMRMLET